MSPAGCFKFSSFRLFWPCSIALAVRDETETRHLNRRVGMLKTAADKAKREKADGD